MITHHRVPLQEFRTLEDYHYGPVRYPKWLRALIVFGLNLFGVICLGVVTLGVIGMVGK